MLLFSIGINDNAPPPTNIIGKTRGLLKRLTDDTGVLPNILPSRMRQQNKESQNTALLTNVCEPKKVVTSEWTEVPIRQSTKKECAQEKKLRQQLHKQETVAAAKRLKNKEKAARRKLRLKNKGQT